MNLIDVKPPHRPIGEIAIAIASIIWQGAGHRWNRNNELMIWGTVRWTADELNDNITSRTSGFKELIGTLYDEWISAYADFTK